MQMRVWSAAVAVLLVAGCGGPDPQALTSKADTSSTDVSNLKIEGDESDPVNQLAMKGIADLEAYWSTEYPILYNSGWEPVEGGFHAVYPSLDVAPPPCASDVGEISGNAFYCSTEDVVAWDAEGLLPERREKFGDFVIPVILAHEYGHAVQARSDFSARTVTRELQAACFGGALARHAKDDGVFDVTAADLDLALAGILDLRDSPGTSKIDSNAHGSGFDRVSAFQDGYDNGLGKCKNYRDDDPMVLELPFSTMEDAVRDGNAPYDSIVNGVPYDIEDYWTQVYPEVSNGQEWPPLRGIEPFDPGSPPMCGDTSAQGYVLFY